MTTKKLVPKIRSLGELRRLAMSDARYARLTLLSARNLGWPIEQIDPANEKAVAGALRWLEDNAGETDEAGVVGEVNFVRDLL